MSLRFSRQVFDHHQSKRVNSTSNTLAALSLLNGLAKTERGNCNYYKDVVMSLVLSRKVGSSITINQNIKVTVLAITSNQVKLGIEAPVDVKIMRQEVLLNDSELDAGALTVEE
jgi:carbon storage regulator